MNIVNIITVIIAVLSAFWLWTDQSYEPLIVCLGSISTLAGFSFYFGIKKNISGGKDNKLTLIKNSKFSMAGFYPSSRNLPSYESTINKANHEICLLGIHGTNFIRLNEDILTKKLSTGCKVRILLMAENDDDGINNNIKQFQDITYHSSILEDLQASRKYNENWINDLNRDLKENIEIKYYKIFPTALYLFVDKEHDNGFVIISPTLPYIKTNDRPAIIIASEYDKDVFKKLAKSFEDIWNNSN
jgi:hypothetical protein